MLKFNTVLRLGLLFLLIFCVSILFFPAKASAIKGDKQSPEIENGVGGMSYPIDDAKNIGVDAGDMAVQIEPEEFSKPKMLLTSSYKIKSGDMIGILAKNFALEQGTLISYNNVKNAKGLQVGQILKVPNQDGILYKGKRNETLESIAKKYSISAGDLQIVNEIFSDKLMENTSLFIPGAKMDMNDLQEIAGDMFLWPARGAITDRYGYRSDPFGGVSREFHNGMDIGAPWGAPVKAAMAGRVTSVVYGHASYGNYVVITHSSGYRTLYAHMSAIGVKSGTYVNAGDRVGDVGSTGRSTGAHLHFTVYKNGVTVNPRLLLR
jgi:murein DD-endopeptidase MepM/ murein hydrolase activator NlpD